MGTILVYLFLALAAVAVVLLVVRQVALWYWRVDDIVSELRGIRALLLQVAQQQAAVSRPLVAPPQLVATPGRVSLLNLSLPLSPQRQP